MVYVFASLEKALDRNETRFQRSQGKDRSLLPSLVLRTWNSVTQNYDFFKKEFGYDAIFRNMAESYCFKYSFKINILILELALYRYGGTWTLDGYGRHCGLTDQSIVSTYPLFLPA